MARTKINYAAQGMFVGPSPATGSHYLDGQDCYGSGSLVKELYRIQGYSYDFNYNKENLGQFGDLANIDYLNMAWPDVNLNFSYLLSNFGNEKNLGFVISSGSQVNALSGIIAGTTEDKNYFIAIHSPEGEDLHNNQNFNYDSAGGIIGFGNGVVTNYSSKTAVGQLPSVDVTVEALNVKVYDKNTSLYTNLMENAGNNGNLDIVNTGGALFKNDYFQDWDIFNNETATVKIVPDPVNISNAINQDWMIINRPSGNAYFTSSTTGATDWQSQGVNAASGYTFINTGTKQLVLRKLGQSASQYYYLTNLNNGFNPRVSTGTWYKLVCDLASSPDISFDMRFGGSNEVFGYPRTGLNTFYLFSTGANNGGLLITTASISGDYIFNSIELFIPQNYSARYYCTGAGGTSYNYLFKDSNNSIYNLLNSTEGNNKRYNLSFDLKYSGFSSLNYGAANSKIFSYFKIGEQTNNNFAGGRFPTFNTSYSGQFNRMELEFSNSAPVNQSTTQRSLYITRLFSEPSGEFWIDNIKLEQTNKTDIINANLFNGSFEVYHPSYVASGAGVVNSFSGLQFFTDPAYSAFARITGSSLLPSYDNKKTFSAQSANIQLINKTGAGNRYVTIAPFLGMPLQNTFTANRRHKFTCYTRYSGVGPTIGFRFTELNNYTYYSESLTNNNSWEYKEVDFIPTGATLPKIEFIFGGLSQDGDQFWIDDVNLYYYDDCYALPVVESVTGGFNIPVNSTTNFSGLATNNSNKSLSVLRPQDVYLNINYADLGPTTGNWKLQSCELNVPIPRENIYNLGIDYPSKKFQNPLIGNFTLNAVLGDLATGNLRDYYLDCDKTYDINYGFFNPCSTQVIADYRIRKACLTSMEFTNTIGNNKTATMNFIFPIGGIAETGRGLFMSGVVFE